MTDDDKLLGGWFVVVKRTGHYRRLMSFETKEEADAVRDALEGLGCEYHAVTKYIRYSMIGDAMMDDDPMLEIHVQVPFVVTVPITQDALCKMMEMDNDEFHIEALKLYQEFATMSPMMTWPLFACVTVPKYSVPSKLPAVDYVTEIALHDAKDGEYIRKLRGETNVDTL